jgi:hypothetical protein
MVNRTITLRMQIGADGTTATIHQRVESTNEAWAEAEGVFYRQR